MVSGYAPRKEWEVINKFLREHDDMAHLGMVFKEYIQERGHGGWDCFMSDDVRGIRWMLTDFVIYHNNRDK